MSAYLTSSLASTDTLTISLNANTQVKTWSFIEASTNLSGGQVLYATQTSWGSVGTTGTPTLNTSQFPSVGDLVVGVGSAENTDTWTGVASPWSTKQSTGFNGGTAATSVSIITQTRVASAYGTLTFNPTLTSCDVKLGIVNFTECDVKARTVAGDTSSSTTTTITIQKSTAAGSIVVLCIAGDNTGAGGTAIMLPRRLLTPSLIRGHNGKRKSIPLV